MGRTAAAGFWSGVRACARTVRRCLGGTSALAAGLVLIGLTLSGACQADPVKGEATFALAGGYARRIEDTVRIHVNTILAARDLAARQTATAGR